jgi:hypothetical protein
MQRRNSVNRVIRSHRRLGGTAAVLLSLAAAGCGASDTAGQSERHVASRPNVRTVKLGMTKPQVRRLLGKPDEVNKVYGLSDLWVDWLWDDDNGKAAVTFSKAGSVTRVMDCPDAVCTVIARRD